MIVCSATLHHVEVKKLAVSRLSLILWIPDNLISLLPSPPLPPPLQNRMMHFPTWVDLKGQDTVPETVHHVVCYVDPVADTSWHDLRQRVTVRPVYQN